MASKLYPPIIGNRIPAFYGIGDKKILVTIPFVNNRSVSYSQISGMTLRIKTIQTDFVVIDKNFSITQEQFNSGEVKVELIDSDWIGTTTSGSIEQKMNIGQFYKIQLAYVDKDDNVGYFSSIGISKFSSLPSYIAIETLDTTCTNYHKYEYRGVYRQLINGGDITEKVYSYRFILEADEGVLADTGWKVHDSTTDELPNGSHDDFAYYGEIDDYHNVYIQQFVETTTHILANTPRYYLEPNEIEKTTSFYIDELVNDFDNGYILLKAYYPFNYDCYVLRNELGKAEKIKIGKLQVDKTFKDFTVEQGKIYEYSLMNDTWVSESKSVFSDFEDIFLYDGERQLKIRYNPSVGSFKKIVMENFTNTIGGQYPVYNRNGNIYYASFPLGGLISYNEDEEKLFLPEYEKADYFRTETESEQNDEIISNTSQSARNFIKERRFREAVLDWLNNGQPKLYRSPSEGIMIVRTTNNSLTPEAQLSRLISNFTSTITEIDGHKYEHLLKYNII